MLTRTLLGAAVAACGLAGIGVAGHAQDFDRTAFDPCNPEAWDKFAYAVENREYGLLAELFNDAQYKVCDFYETAELLYCQENPAACIEPAGGPPDDTPGDDPNNRGDGPFPGQAPGQSIGVENDDGDDGGGGNEPSGGSEPSGGNGDDRGDPGK